MKTINAHRRVLIAAGISAAIVVAAITGLAATRPTTEPLPAEQIDASEPIPPQTDDGGEPAQQGPGDTVPIGVDALIAEAFAREVASVVFDWDTTATTREDVITGVLAIADEDEANGLLFDLDTYLPSPTDWATLRDLGTRQHIEIDTVKVPNSWAGIVAANADQVSPGTTAFTITGTRHREGLWHGQAEIFDEPVAFTAFITCTTNNTAEAPDAKADAKVGCVLLRLSAINNPLD